MKVGIIGTGKMAEAIIAALLKGGRATAAEIIACDIDGQRRAAIKRQFGVSASADNAEVAAAPTIFVAVKPHHLEEALGPAAAALTARHLILSIAAGKRLAGIEALLPRARVIRVMPNLATLVGEGMSAFCLGKSATAADRATAVDLLSAFGDVLELPEDQLDAVTAVSGSGPAFFAYLLERVADAGAAEGLARADALRLALQTMLGTARLLIAHGTAPADLIKSVATPRGTTAAGLAVLEASGVAAALRDTIAAAARRSRELSA